MKLRHLLVLFFLTSFCFASPFTNWIEFPVGSPAYIPPYAANTLPDDYFPSVIFNADKFNGDGDSVFYKMWHQSTSGVGYTTSKDGITWEVPENVITTAPNPVHVAVVYDAEGFGGGSNFYRMWMWTGQISETSPPHLAINLVESADGKNWSAPIGNTQDTTQFLVNTNLPGQPFYQFYGFGQVIYNANATSIPGQPFTFPYVVFFDSSAAEIAPQTTQEAVGLAYSSDGINWIRFGTLPVLLPSGSTADWDGKYAFRATVIKLDDGYHMYYSGSSGINNPNPAFGYTFGIGHASSANGLNWTQDSDNPIFTILDGDEPWRRGRTLAPWVVIQENAIPSNCSCCPKNIQLQMWFSGGNNTGGSFETAAIGYATLSLIGSVKDMMWLKE